MLIIMVFGIIMIMRTMMMTMMMMKMMMMTMMMTIMAARQRCGASSLTPFLIMTILKRGNEEKTEKKQK